MRIGDENGRAVQPNRDKGVWQRRVIDGPPERAGRGERSDAALSTVHDEELPFRSGADLRRAADGARAFVEGDLREDLEVVREARVGAIAAGPACH
ncbi:MAG: hypothetical protein Q8N53_21900 [Longimicrobiales bacterium]|nr:hypothetical protein [Longimicrobiales bacterium]